MPLLIHSQWTWYLMLGPHVSGLLCALAKRATTLSRWRISIGLDTAGRVLAIAQLEIVSLLAFCVVVWIDESFLVDMRRQITHPLSNVQCDGLQVREPFTNPQ